MTIPIPRANDRALNTMRAMSFERNFLEYAEGSCLVKFGRTWVLCAVSVEDKAPPFLSGSGQGWLTAEYAMMPKSTRDRIPRDRNRGGRSQEISRLIGRSLRCVVDLEALGERTIHVDCDVVQADGGTRTAAISGASVALHDACSFLQKHNIISSFPLKEMAAAVSVGLIDATAYLDLDYNEDSNADVDFNVVKTDTGNYIEIQGTAEQQSFSQNQLQELLAIADEGIEAIVAQQRAVLA